MRPSETSTSASTFLTRAPCHFLVRTTFRVEALLETCEGVFIYIVLCVTGFAALDVQRTKVALCCVMLTMAPSSVFFLLSRKGRRCRNVGRNVRQRAVVCGWSFEGVSPCNTGNRGCTSTTRERSWLYAGPVVDVLADEREVDEAKVDRQVRLSSLSYLDVRLLTHGFDSGGYTHLEG